MRDKGKFLELFRDQFIGDDVDSIQMETEFRKTSSWDSLTGMALLVMIKDSYDVDMSTEDFMASKTVEDVYDFVINKIGNE